MEFHNCGSSQKMFFTFIANMLKMAYQFFENYKKIATAGVCVSDSWLLRTRAALFLRVLQKFEHFLYA